MDTLTFFPLIIAIVAFLYASVGHGGASGYLATMVLAGISSAEMKSSALLLNIFVSAIAFIQYYRGGYFKGRLLWPFVLLSVPFSFIGSKIPLDNHVYKIILAICLALAILRLLGIFGKNQNENAKPVHIPFALFCGAVIGLISGMIGIGGGILLTPVLLLSGYANLKEAAVISAAFIFLNSVSGLAGAFTSGILVSPGIYAWAMAAIAGGVLGAYFGSFRFSTFALKYILSAVLLFACFKLIIT